MEPLEPVVDHPDPRQPVHEWDLDAGHWLDALLLALFHEDVQGEDDQVPELPEDPQLAPDVREEVKGKVVVRQVQSGRVQGGGVHVVGARFGVRPFMSFNLLKLTTFVFVFV